MLIQEVSDPNIGRTWTSPHGTRTVIGIITIGSTPRYQINTEGRRDTVLLPPDQLDREIMVDESNTKSRAAAREQEIQIQQTDQAQHKELHTLDGFETLLTPMAHGKAVNTLTTKGIRNNGQFYRNIRDLIRTLIGQEYTVVDSNRGRRLQSPQGNFLDEKQITKIGMDYADYLSRK